MKYVFVIMVILLSLFPCLGCIESSEDVFHVSISRKGDKKNIVFVSNLGVNTRRTWHKSHRIQIQDYGSSVIIQNVYHEPEYPEYSDSVTVYAEVYGADGVYLNYTSGNQYHYVEMSKQTDNIYYYVISPNRYGTVINYRIQAYNDTASEFSFSVWYSFNYSDYTPPGVFDIRFPVEGITKKPLKFSVNATEPENASGIYGVWIVLQFSTDNRSWGSSTLYDMVYNESSRLWELKISFIDYGYYRLYFVAQDNAGNLCETPSDSYYYLHIYPRYADIIGNNVSVAYSDSVLIRIQLIDLNNSAPIKYEFIDVYINKTSGAQYIATIQTNGTGYGWFTLDAAWSVGTYEMVFIFEHPSYKRLEKKFMLVIVPEGVDIELEYDTNTYNATLEIDIMDDDGEGIGYGYVRVVSGSVLFDKKLNDLMDIMVSIDIFDAVNYFANGSWWLAVNITFYGNPNYEDTIKEIIIPIYATIVDVIYNSSVKQGECIDITINITDVDGLINYTIKVDENILRGGSVFSQNIELCIRHNISISTKIGEHDIVIEVVDAKGDKVSRAHKFTVEETKIILYAEFSVTEGEMEIIGSTKYECDWNPENIAIKVIVQQGEEVKIYSFSLYKCSFEILFV